MNKRKKKTKEVRKVLRCRLWTDPPPLAETIEFPMLVPEETVLPPAPTSEEDSDSNESEAFRQVGKEVLDNRLDPESWAQALAESRGTHDDAMAQYARIRSQKISQAQREQKEKVQELESRRRGSFRDFRKVPVVTRPKPGESGFPGLVDSVFWHVLAVVGLTGSLLAARLLWPGFCAKVSYSEFLGIVLLMQLIPLLSWWAGNRGIRGISGRVSYPGVVQLTACVALLSSVLLGVELFKNGDRMMAERLAEPLMPIGHAKRFVQIQPNLNPMKRELSPEEASQERVAKVEESMGR